MEVFSYKEMCLGQQDKVKYVVMFIYAQTVMCSWKYDVGDCMEKRPP